MTIQDFVMTFTISEDLVMTIPTIFQDFVHVMCYDYHGKWDKKTGHNAPLYSRPGETGKKNI